jgi:hypothetical protein
MMRSVIARSRLQRKGKRRSLIHRRVGPDPSSMTVDDPLHRSQADPASGELPRPVQPLKRTEELVGILHLTIRAKLRR